jgi:hypothetical protein
MVRRAVPRPSRLLLAVALVAVLALALTACGGKGSDTTAKPKIGVKGDSKDAATDLGFPAFATKNTTRVGGADSAANAAGVAQAVYSAGSKVTRPKAVALVDSRDWRIGLAASVLMSAPIRAPMLYSDGRDMPAASTSALAGLKPLGSQPAGDAQVIRVGDVARPSGVRTTDIAGKDIFGLARALDAFQAAAHGTTSDRVVIVSADDPAFAMPAAAWAAKSGDPILFTHRGSLPPDTRAAIASHQQPKIYILGPPKAVSRKVERDLRKLGTVKRVSGPDPVNNSIAFARYIDGDFGWGAVDPGHGMVFANVSRPLDAGAAAPLSASGSYGPLLLVKDADRITRGMSNYLLDIQPGYDKDPVRGVYNHAWIIGDVSAISVPAQSHIDALLEIVPIGDRPNR